MIRARLRRKQLLASLCALSGAVACAPETNNQQAPAPVAQEPEVLQQVYVSNLRATTSCGVAHFPTVPPGLAVPVGVPVRDMPEAIAKRQAVGADRPLAETDPERVSPGFVVIDPGDVWGSFLINNEKEVVASFEGDYPIPFSQILPNGNRLVSSNGSTDTFLKGGGYRGCIEEYAPDGSLVWRISLNTDTYVHHHDVVKMNNGNILAVVWHKASDAEAISLGRNPELIAENKEFWYDGIVEINPYTAEIVWEWSIRHHMVQEFDRGKLNYGVVADHPELLDINTVKFDMDGSVADDWTHVNAIDYNEELDQIAISSNHLSEIWIIDHSTTPREAASHKGGRNGMGGDFLYRWGIPERYGRGTPEHRTLFNQHDVQWIKPGLPGAGNLLILNNGDDKARPYTTVTEIAPAMNADGSYVLRDGEAYGPTTLTWEYNPEPPERFYSWFISGAQRLPNGNTLVNHGAAGRVREVTASGDIVWEYEYTNEVDAPHMLFRANRYPPDHPGILKILGQSQ